MFVIILHESWWFVVHSSSIYASHQCSIYLFSPSGSSVQIRMTKSCIIADFSHRGSPINIHFTPINHVHNYLVELNFDFPSGLGQLSLACHKMHWIRLWLLCVRNFWSRHVFVFNNRIISTFLIAPFLFRSPLLIPDECSTFQFSLQSILQRSVHLTQCLLHFFCPNLINSRRTRPNNYYYVTLEN